VTAGVFPDELYAVLAVVRSRLRPLLFAVFPCLTAAVTPLGVGGLFPTDA